jgi:hypothetical protein
MGRQKQNAERCQADAGMFDALMLATGNWQLATQHNTTQHNAQSSTLNAQCAMRNAQCALST